MIRVDANLFRLAYGAVSTEETRYYLNGVFIEPHPGGGAMMVSTDCHRLIAAHDDLGACDKTVIVKLPKAFLSQCKGGKGRRLDLTIDPEADTATLSEEERTISSSRGVLIDGVFPDWWRVVPKIEAKPVKSAPTAFNPAYLGDWAALGKDIGKTIGGSGALRIALSDGASPVVIRYANPSIFGVLMPIRSTEVESSFLPAFMNYHEPKQVAAE